jgi:mannose-6-phosphate isomerase-like protein (cupin superfamily)
VVTEVSAEQLLEWVDGYQRAWRTEGTEGLRDLFSDDAEYFVSPYDVPVVGLAAIRQMWDEDRNGPDEVFMMTAEVVACQGPTGVARVRVRYGDPLVQEYLDLWVVRFAIDGRADRFEEWPFWPTHGRAPARTEPAVLARDDVPSGRYVEWVRSQSLSAGVYRIAAGGVDDQSPHREDEVYVVTVGAASLEVEGRRTPVGPGTVAFVPRRADHRFVEVTEDLEVSVVFAPPESNGSGAED